MTAKYSNPNLVNITLYLNITTRDHDQSKETRLVQPHPQGILPLRLIRSAKMSPALVADSI